MHYNISLPTYWCSSVCQNSSFVIFIINHINTMVNQSIFKSLIDLLSLTNHHHHSHSSNPVQAWLYPTSRNPPGDAHPQAEGAPEETVQVHQEQQMETVHQETDQPAQDSPSRWPLRRATHVGRLPGKDRSNSRRFVSEIWGKLEGTSLIMRSSDFLEFVLPLLYRNHLLMIMFDTNWKPRSYLLTLFLHSTYSDCLAFLPILLLSL